MIALFASSLLFASPPQVAPEPEFLALRAKTVLTGDGPPLEDATILIQDGKIVAVGKDVRVPAGAREFRHAGVASAGMIALHGRPGLAAPARQESATIIFFGPEGGPHGAHPHGGETHVEDEHEHEHGEAPPAADEGELDPADPLAMDEAAATAASSYSARDTWSDATRTILPEARMAFAFDPAHSAFQKLARAGVTSVVLTPARESLVAGQSAVVKTSGGTVLREAAQLSLGFQPASLRSNVYPTSHSGALDELERRFAKPEGAYARAKKGELGVLFETDSRQDVLRAADFARRHGLRGAVSGAELSGEVAEALRAAGLAAIVGPFEPGASSRALRSVAALAQAGVPFGFGLDLPRESPDALRFAAAACVAAGVERELVWSALSSKAAVIAGVSERVGRLARGFDADIVLWSGHPLDLASRVEGVVIDGRLIEAEGGAR